MAAILKWFKKFRPLTNSTENFRHRTCVRNFIKSNPSVWLLPYDHTHKQQQKFVLGYPYN